MLHKKKAGFAAKLAHELSTEGKVICPTCESEVIPNKIIQATYTEKGHWRPKSVFVGVCKCNQKDVHNGKF